MVTPPRGERPEQERFDRLLERLHESLPHRLAVIVAWLVRPEAIWVRLPVALLCIVGGVFSFLPLLGLWMLPLGVMLLAIDFPPVRGFVVRVWPKIEARLRLLRQRWSRSSR